MPAILRARRSALYVPGNNPRALDKGRSIPADVLILDLEDSVPPEQKETARAAVGAAVGVRAYGRREVVIRVNGLETPWIARDIAAAVGARPDAILVPKLSRIEDIRRARAALAAAQAGSHIALWAMIETPLAVLNVGAIAALATGPGVPLACLVMGLNDLAAEMGARLTPGRPAMLPHLANALAAARAYDIAILDGTYNELNNWEGFREECEQGRDLGMDGKTLIHPRQVQIANDVFTPSQEEVEWAGRIISAFAQAENNGKAVISLDGKMVERLHERAARKTLELAEAILPNDAA